MVEKIERKIPASVEKVYTLFAAAHAGTAFLGESLKPKYTKYRDSENICA